MNQEYKNAIDNKRKAIKILEDSNFNSTLDYFLENGAYIKRALKNEEFIQSNSKLNINVGEYEPGDYFNLKIGENQIRFVIISEDDSNTPVFNFFINNKIIFKCLMILQLGHTQLLFHEDYIKKICIDKKVLQIVKSFEKICNQAVLFDEKNEEKKRNEKERIKEKKIIEDIKSNISIGDLDN